MYIYLYIKDKSSIIYLPNKANSALKPNDRWHWGLSKIIAFSILRDCINSCLNCEHKFVTEIIKLGP